MNTNDKLNFEIFYNLEQSTNYNLLLNNSIDSTFLSPPSQLSLNGKITISNNSLVNRCIALNKVYKCSNQIIEDKLCLIYLDAYEGEEGIKVEFNYFDEFDSIYWMTLSESKKKLTYKNEIEIVEKAFSSRNKD